MSMEYMVQLVTAFLGSMGFALVFHIRREKLVLASLGGLLSWGIYLALSGWTEQDVPRFLAATAAAAIYAEIMARVLKAPATGFLIVGILPFVPGGGIYYTMEYCLSGDTQQFLSTGIHTFGVAGAVAVGLLLASSLVRLVLPIFHKKEKAL